MTWLGKLFYTTLGFAMGSAVMIYLTGGISVKKRRQIRFDDSEKEDGNDGKGKHDKAHVDFLTGIVAHLWDYINPAGSKMIREIMEPMLKEYFPSGPLSSMKVVKVDLGEVPLLLDNVVVREIDRERGFVQFEMDVVWDGKCEIKLKADLIGAFGIRAIKLRGRMSFVLKPLTPELPCVGAITYAFINSPELDLDFTGAAHVADFSVIDTNVRDIIMDTLNSMVVLPKRMTSNLISSCTLLQSYQEPLGVARVTLVRGRGFVVEHKILGADDVPDVYCNVTMADSVTRTPTTPNQLEPEWNHDMDFVVFDLEQTVHFHAWDEDDGQFDADDDLGYCQVSIRDLLLAQGHAKEKQLMFDSSTSEKSGSVPSPTGAYLTIHCDLLPLIAPTLELLSSFGLFTVIINQAFDIPLEKTEAVTSVKVTIGNKTFATGAVKNAVGVDALNPTYASVFHMSWNDQKEMPSGPGVELALMQRGEIVLGKILISLEELIKTPTIQGRRPIGDKGAQLEFRVSLGSVESSKKKMTTTTTATITSTGDANAGGIDTPSADNIEPTPSDPSDTVIVDAPEEQMPSGSSQARDIIVPTDKIQVTVIEGKGFQVKKKLLMKDDVPDPYCKVQVGGEKMTDDKNAWKTTVIRNTTNPKWNESKVFEVPRGASNDEILIHVNVYDANSGRLNHDDFCGSASISVEKLLLAAGGALDVEVKRNGGKTGLFITLGCSRQS